MKKRVAIIGSGVAGLTCAWLLREKYDVSLFEANDYAGGHTQTTDVEVNGTTWPVNTGFIVYLTLLVTLVAFGIYKTHLKKKSKIKAVVQNLYYFFIYCDFSSIYKDSVKTNSKFESLILAQNERWWYA